MALDAFQADVARIALDAAGEHGFALAGGNALVAHGIVQRTTEDVDLFSNEAGGPGAVTAAVQVALKAAGYQ
ncbi:MAG TPA: nucleotidyl transferase AbiEii/AbiGii toxin family protein, partial [Actinomycetota bacterium]|nr:nucleotidyl transferase AbiEii/AbiGii toxin family protein [Actinomycetota bacterium]